jgi:hypothetical protein
VHPEAIDQQGGRARRRVPALQRALLVGVTLWLGALAGTAAGTVDPTHVYAIELIDRMPTSYRLELPVEAPGTLVVEAEWEGPRLLSLRIDRPDGSRVRRAGQSPLRIETEVAPDEVDLHPWLLSVNAVPTRGAAEGLLSIRVPLVADEPAADSTPAAAPRRDRPEARPEPWERPRAAPPRASSDLASLFEATERYRATVTAPDGDAPPDACEWQDDLLRFLAERRDGLADHGAAPSRETTLLLERIVDAVETVEELRASLDPVIGGPPPRSPRKLRAWLVKRRERMQEIEAELDGLLATIQRGHVPELAAAEWPARLVTCLAACQRHFEERVRLGEDRAVNRDLAQAQWDVVLRAVDALRLLTVVDATDADVRYTRQ